MPKPTPECGTNGGYLAHRRNGEEACGPCKAAHAGTSAGWREQHGATPRPKGPEHGTRAAYMREWRAFKAGAGSEPCEECKAANALRRRKVYQAGPADQTVE